MSIGNWEMDLKSCEEQKSDYQNRLAAVERRESLARDGVEMLKAARGTTAASARGTFEGVLLDCAEERTQLTDALQRMKNRIAALQGYLREAKATSAAEERSRMVNKLLLAVGEPRSVV